LTLVGNHFTGTDQGHQVKSRALENFILYNRIEDSPAGNSSRLIDLPNCGFSIIMGNDLHQGAGSGNLNMIGYGMEGCEARTARQKQLYVVNNSLLNDALTATVVNNRADGWALVANNLLRGNGTWLSGKGEAVDNLREARGDASTRQWGLSPGSRAIDAAVTLPQLSPATAHSLIPQRQFNPPAGSRPRPLSGALDIGSREWVTSGAQQPGD
ncbi:MAG: hypothetical protein KDI09_17090, partial [Halioglobus sp.]|nr:hypothetical protein [Halioglobus sp.]